jgi:hypothetical protein
MSSKINVAIMVAFTAFAILGASIALLTTGFFDTSGVSNAYAQNDTMMGGDNMTGGNMTGMGNMTG